jgi:hypothetical protein
MASSFPQGGSGAVPVASVQMSDVFHVILSYQYV